MSPWRTGRNKNVRKQLGGMVTYGAHKKRVSAAISALLFPLSL